MDKWLLPKIVASRINDITWSDHALVTLSVADLPGVNSCFIWWSNSKLIQDGRSKVQLQKELTNFFSCNANSVADPMVLWNHNTLGLLGESAYQVWICGWDTLCHNGTLYKPLGPSVYIRHVIYSF